VPHDDGVTREGPAQRLPIAVADLLAPHQTSSRSPEETPEAAESAEVERDEQVDTGQHVVEHGRVDRVDHPCVTRDDRAHAADLLGDRHLHPARFPGEIIDGVERQPADVGELTGERRLAGTGHAVHRDAPDPVERDRSLLHHVVTAASG
jgi:hypothetical protein